MLKDTLRNMNLYVDGKGFAGAIDEIILPKLALKTEEYRGGGTDVPIEVETGMEKLEMGFTISKFDSATLSLFGLKPGKLVPITVRGSVLSEDDGKETPLVITLRGIVREMDFGTWKAGDNATVKMMVAIRYYRLVRDDTELQEIDIANMIRKVNGVDQLAETRSNIGL